MNKFKISILIAATAFVASSCEDKLEEPQKGVVTVDNFYQTDDDALGARTAMYANFIDKISRGTQQFSNYNVSSYIHLYNLCADDVYAGGEKYGDNFHMTELNEFIYDNTQQQIQDVYGGFYKIIYTANLIINNFKEGESDIKDQCIAEAKVVRAFCHMMLAIGWYNPPLVTSILTPDQLQTNSESQEFLLNWCAEQCIEALPYLKERADVNDKDATAIITKGAAQTIAGKAYLFASKWDNKYYALAEKQLKDVIESGKYALVPSNRIDETFHDEGDGNEETILSLNLESNPNLDEWSFTGRSVWQHSQIWGWRNGNIIVPDSLPVGWGGLGVREDFGDEFVANEGNSPRRKAWIRILDPEVLYEMDYGKNDTVNGVALTLDEKKKDPNRGIPNYIYGYTKYLHFKRQYRIDENFGDNRPKTNFLVFRYAEVLLMYAECCQATGNTAEGLKYLNEIQDRAGAPRTDLTLEAVKKEKKFEMFLECCRWPDMVRWGDTDGVVMNGDWVPCTYDAYFDANGSEKGTGTTEPIHRIYTEKERHHDNDGMTPGFKKGKHEYFPFPHSAVYKNNQLKQQFGWASE